jgi:hypothetical protein
MQEKQSPKVGTGMIIQPFHEQELGLPRGYSFSPTAQILSVRKGTDGRIADAGTYSSASDVLSGSDLMVGAFFGFVSRMNCGDG